MSPFDAQLPDPRGPLALSTANKRLADIQLARVESAADLRFLSPMELVDLSVRVIKAQQALNEEMQRRGLQGGWHAQ